MKLQWEPPPGLGGVALSKATEGISAEKGTAKYEDDIPSELLPGDHAFGIKRESQEVAVRGRINARAGTNSFAVTFFIPPKRSAHLEPDPFYLNEHRDIAHGDLYGSPGEVVYNLSPPQSVINDVEYPQAIRMHPKTGVIGYAVWNIPKGAKYFKSVFGLAKGANGRVAGRVKIDEQLVWEGTVSGSGSAGLPTHAIELPDDDEDHALRLEVDPLGTHDSDHATWGDPHFTAL